jgi:hypothetical protein
MAPMFWDAPRQEKAAAGAGEKEHERSSRDKRLGSQGGAAGADLGAVRAPDWASRVFHIWSVLNKAGGAMTPIAVSGADVAAVALSASPTFSVP